MLRGNIRCLLKLAGTEYWPDMNGKILFLEARSGQNSQMTNYLSHLKQLGVFEQIHGLVFGTFSELEAYVGMPQMKDLIAEYIDEKLPFAMTREVGHGADSKAVRIGENLIVERK